MENLKKLAADLNTILRLAENVRDQQTTAARPVRVQLSVDQAGMLARAALDSGLIQSGSFTRLCRELAPHLVTTGTPHPSPGSLRANAYPAEQGDKLPLIRYLEKMIRLIEGY